jgi:hypothetical protein
MILDAQSISIETHNALSARKAGAAAHDFFVKACPGHQRTDANIQGAGFGQARRE